MKKPVNLNKFRKIKIQSEKKERNTANSIKFGQTKLEKQVDIYKNKLQKQRLDQLKREP